jgi:hypothetical protein
VAPALAASVTFSAAPGLNVGEAGFALTPAGNPVMLIATCEAKLPIALACNESAVPVVPVTSVCDAGTTVNEKSGGDGRAVVVSATVAVWLSMPEVPVRVMAAEPLATVASAVKVMFCATPGTSVSIAGLAETPVGSPLGATVTFPAKPCIALAITLTGCPDAPPVTDAVAGETFREKSGVVVRSGMLLPHPLIARIVANEVTMKETRKSSLLRILCPRAAAGADSWMIGQAAAGKCHGLPKAEGPP